ncbi:MAG: DUF4956 domain-containing protein [Clostridia bacterium]
MSLNQIFSGVFDNSLADTLDISNFLICMFVALMIGMFISALYTYKTKYTKSFVVTLAMLPAIVSVIIMMVNGNVGAGVAVAGAFSLVRFRSVPGTAKEIGVLFQAMGAGLAIGMGYLGYAVVFVVLVSLASFILTLSPFGESNELQKTLVVTIPEHLDYTGVFDDLFEQYTKEVTLNRVKTTNMGSLLKITYDIILKDEKHEKQFIDDLRCRNGNLEIIIAKQQSYGTEL